MKEVLEKRLLHPGVNTRDILTGYVAAIKTIRHLDNTGVLLETITEPVKQYMRSRQDTVRCVASALTDDGPTDLAEELAKSEAYVEKLSNKNDDWENWTPDPIDASTSMSLHIIIPISQMFSIDEKINNDIKPYLFQKIKSRPAVQPILYRWWSTFMAAKKYL